MRVVSAKVRNFASYKELAFDFTQAGLALVAGPTGSGKSTLCDIVPWCLFGVTAKGGKVDEILSWPGDQVTSANIEVDVGDTTYYIHRSRGPKAKDNDLFFYSLSSIATPTRGKDIPDTQRLINQLLGMNADLYLGGAYFHEFSQTAQFFTTTAKHRRSICEQIVDLSLATKLQASLAMEYKTVKKDADRIEANMLKLQDKIAYIQQSISQSSLRVMQWNRVHAKKLLELQAKYDSFEKDQQQALSAYLDAEEEFLLKPRHRVTQCSECGQHIPGNVQHTPHNPFTTKIDAVLARENTYKDQIAEVIKEVNPYREVEDELTVDLNDAELDLGELSGMAKGNSIKLTDLEILQEVTAAYRSVVISNTIDYIETQTNQLLTDHFDAEIRVTFQVEDADKLDVTIHKDGNVATYTQLSKGQRQLLKLCFGIAVMRGVANHHGIRFHQVFFDEALDGLDEQMKAKAFKLLTSIAAEYESVFCVEHSEGLKNMFTNKYSVELVNGASQIEKT